MTLAAMCWTAYTKNVDVDTGEIITAHERDTNYIVIKKTKYAKLNRIKTRGTIEYTNLCRRRAAQGTLNFDKEGENSGNTV